MLPYTACYQEYCVHVRACLWFQSSDIIAALIGFTYFSTRKTQGLRAPVGFRLLQGRLNECSISTVQGLPNRSKHPLGFCLIGICSCNNITAVLLISPAAPWGGIATEWAHRPQKGQKENERDIYMCLMVWHNCILHGSPLFIS
jgi:hypothetical protein